MLLGQIARLRLPGTGTIVQSFMVLRLRRADPAVTVDCRSLEVWFGLSPAEAKLAAAFANGVSLADYARGQGLSINTVRTNFAHVKAKLNAPDQAAVVRIVLRAAMQE